jgi:hypothetical protein
MIKQNAINLIGSGYVWGTKGEVLTEELLEQLESWHGKQHYDDPNNGINARKWLGTCVHDCSGLIQDLFDIHGEKICAAELYTSYCTPIACDMVQDGDLAFKENTDSGEIYHVAYINDVGQGQTIEAKSTELGVVYGVLGEFNLFGRIKNVLGESHIFMNPPKTYAQILTECTTNPVGWGKCINVGVAIGKQNGTNDYGALQILEWLPELIEKVYEYGRTQK